MAVLAAITVYLCASAEVGSAAHFVEQLSRKIPFYDMRHVVRPGCTGWAQVRWRYGASEEDAMQKLQYDLYYVKNHTLFLDLMILFETVSVVLTGKGAR